MLGDLVERQRVERDDVVDAVEELRPERRPQRFLQHAVALFLLGAALGEHLDELASPRCSS